MINDSDLSFLYDDTPLEDYDKDIPSETNTDKKIETIFEELRDVYTIFYQKYEKHFDVNFVKNAFLSYYKSVKKLTMLKIYEKILNEFNTFKLSVDTYMYDKTRKFYYELLMLIYENKNKISFVDSIKESAVTNHYVDLDKSKEVNEYLNDLTYPKYLKSIRQTYISILRNKNQEDEYEIPLVILEVLITKGKVRKELKQWTLEYLKKSLSGKFKKHTTSKSTCLDLYEKELKKLLEDLKNIILSLEKFDRFNFLKNTVKRKNLIIKKSEAKKRNLKRKSKDDKRSKKLKQ